MCKLGDFLLLVVAFSQRSRWSLSMSGHHRICRLAYDTPAWDRVRCSAGRRPLDCGDKQPAENSQLLDGEPNQLYGWGAVTSELKRFFGAITNAE